jgi:TolB-like protein/DNA-binding winged helix-turn-helix (wHTH) protein/Tfp pilus assembly protein PilF
MSGLTSKLYVFGEFCLDTQNRMLRKGEEPISLTPKAFEVLLLLIQHASRVVTKDELMQTVWPDSFVEESNLTQTVFMLRKALGEASNQRYILTVPGRGYRFATGVTTFPGNGHLGADIGSTSAREGANTFHDPERPVTQGDSAENSSIETQPIRTAGEAQVPERRTQRRPPLAFALLALIPIGLAVWLVPAISRRASASLPLHSIAVLPLDNFSGDPSEEYFVDGMTDELTTDLAKVSSLRVISRTSVMRYKGTKKGLPEIARELNVDGIVEGSVTRSGQRIRITAQLIHAPTDRHLWAETYERDLGDVLRLQNEVAQTIAQRVRAEITPQQQARLRSAPAVNPEAYDAYLRGRFYLATQFSTPKQADTARSYFEEAIRKDPGFALAYAGLADSYISMGFFRYLSPERAYRFAKDAAGRALKLDENLGEAHTTLALLNWQYDWDRAAAEQKFNYAIALAPSYDCLRCYHSGYLAWRGQRSEALAEITRARELNPSSSFDSAEAAVNYQLRDYASMVEASRRGLSSEPNEWLDHYLLGIGYEGIGRRAEAIPEFQKAVKMSNGDQDASAALAHAWAVSGRRTEAEKILHDLERKSKTVYVSPYMIATIYAGLGDKDKAFKLLEKAYKERSLDLVWNLKSDLRVDDLRSDPRFQNLLNRVGFDQ